MQVNHALPRVAGTIIPARTARDVSVLAALASAREHMFGREPTSRWITSLEAKVGASQARAATYARESVRRADAASDLSLVHAGLGRHAALDGVLRRIDGCIEDATNLGDPLRVVLMGRTQAGKSTVLEVLTGGDGARIGDGRQRNSRDVEERRCIDAPEVLLVDTPGVGAADGDQDFDLAFSQVPTADLVLWVASSEPTHVDTAKALRRLAAYGKPIVIALNCRAGLEIDIAREDFLADPSSVFDGKIDFLPAVHRQLAEGSGRLPRAVLIHAQAAYLARSGDPDGDRLWSLSGIDELIAVIREEAEANGVQRRAMRVIDAVRMPVVDLLACLDDYVSRLDSAAIRWQRRNFDAGQRMMREVAKSSEILQAAALEVTLRRRQWHATDAAHPDGKVEEAWREEVDRMQGELRAVFANAQMELLASLERVDLAVGDEWANTPEPSLGLRDLTDFGSVLPNMALKITAAALAGGLVVAASAATAGVGTVFAIGVGLIMVPAIALGLEHVTDFIGTIFKGKDQIRRERREKTGKQVGPLLDKVDGRARIQVAQYKSAFDSGIGTFLSDGDTQRGRMLAEREALVGAVSMLVAEVSALDLLAGRALLEGQGRARLASSLTSATRIPGVCIAAAAKSNAYTEAVLFPASGAVESVVIWPNDDLDRGAQGLRLLTQLTPGRLRVEALGRWGSEVTLLDDDVTDSLRSTWGSLIRRVTGTAFDIRRIPTENAEKGTPDG